MNINNDYYLSADKYRSLVARGFDFSETHQFDGDENSAITAEQLYKYIPPIAKIDGSECKAVLTTDWIDDEELFILSYERIEDMWVCKTFSGDKLTDVLYDAIDFFDSIGALPRSCYKTEKQTVY